MLKIIPSKVRYDAVLQVLWNSNLDLWHLDAFLFLLRKTRWEGVGSAEAADLQL